MKKVPQVQRKQAMGYERHPPSCGNCSHYQWNTLDLPRGAPSKPGKCTYGGFVTFSGAVCDVWAGRSGETLE